jgi:hypothetical protein
MLAEIVEFARSKSYSGSSSASFEDEPAASGGGETGDDKTGDSENGGGEKGDDGSAMGGTKAAHDEWIIVE